MSSKGLWIFRKFLQGKTRGGDVVVGTTIV